MSDFIALSAPAYKETVLATLFEGDQRPSLELLIGHPT